MTGDGDKLGVRWGLAGGTELSTVDEVRALAAWAGEAGFDSFWVSQANAVDPVVALAASFDACRDLTEVGTSVVPLYGRHPVSLGQLVRTAQSALDGRLTLGIGPSHAGPVSGTYGLEWDRPFGFTAEFIEGLQPLLEGRPAALEGDQLTARAELDIDAPDTPILLAALGPRMLELAGRTVAGTTVGQCGPITIRTHVAPRIREAAAAAGRPEPRIMALIRLCVTDDVAGARALAREIGARYAAFASYAAVQAREGLADPGDLHLIGSWEQVLDGLGRYAEAGVTDFRLEIAASDERSRETSREALAAHLA